LNKTGKNMARYFQIILVHLKTLGTLTCYLGLDIKIYKLQSSMMVLIDV